MLKPTRKVPAYGITLAGESGSFVTRKVARSGNDHQYLRLAEDIGLAQNWLANGAPIADVITMLEARHRFELSPTH